DQHGAVRIRLDPGPGAHCGRGHANGAALLRRPVAEFTQETQDGTEVRPNGRADNHGFRNRSRPDVTWPTQPYKSGHRPGGPVPGTAGAGTRSSRPRRPTCPRVAAVAAARPSGLDDADALGLLVRLRLLRCRGALVHGGDPRVARGLLL